MQGHPESPRLWEKHADAILRDIGLTPTTHEPCLYSGTIAGQRVIFKRQVDNFAIATATEKTANILLDLIDDALSIPLKRQGLLDMFNGINVTQTQDYIKIDCQTYIDKFCEKYLQTWLHKVHLTENRPTPLPTDPAWLKKFNAAVGPTDPKQQQHLASKMEIKYKAGVGELIWAMTTCRPDISFTSVKLSQSNSAPAEHHYHGLKHAIRFLYLTRHDGIYFWRTRKRDDLQAGPLPKVNSNFKDLLLDDRPQHAATIAVAYGDSDWASCVKTRRSFSGICIQLAGGTIAYKTKFQPTVALSSTEAEFMAACDVGRMCLFIRSILWDLDIPQEAATVAYEDNDGCTSMGNAQKPTPRTRHIDIKYFALCDWIKRDLIILERIDTSINPSDHLTKPLSRILFHRHADFLLGHVPPQYSPIYRHALTTYGDFYKDIDTFVPDTFTTPTTARAARIHAPILEDITDNPWLIVIWHEDPFHTYSVDCGGVLVYT
jgi:KUP system potassium uptake protein